MREWVACNAVLLNVGKENKTIHDSTPGSTNNQSKRTGCKPLVLRDIEETQMAGFYLNSF